jgi:hypothetical protein
MRKNRLKFRNCARIISTVILMSFLKFPMYAEPLTGLERNLSENETRLYSDYEIEILIDEITEAALEAIDQAAAEAARAAMLTMLEREAAAIREAARQQAEALRWQIEADKRRRAGIWGAVITGLVCLAGGLVVGIGISN